MSKECGKELIHCNRDDELRNEGSTYTICRVKVPRMRLVREIKADLHPAFYAREYPGGWFAVGKPDARHVNNINKTTRCC